MATSRPAESAKSGSPTPGPTATGGSGTPRLLADQAVALASGNGARDKATASLIELAGDETRLLEQARELLVRRLRQRSDDYAATSGLSLLNTALSQLGPRDDLQWQPRVWKIPH